MYKLILRLWVVWVWMLLASQPAHAVVNICEKTGFFSDFLQENLVLTGNCDDRNANGLSDNKVLLRLKPRGLELTGLGVNPPILLKLSSDTESTIKNVTQFGITGHTGTLTVNSNAEIDIHLQNADGGNCDVIARGGSRCIYDVVTTSCPTQVLVGDKVCAGCTAPTACKDYGNQPMTFYVQGQPVFECNLTLSRVSTRCQTCNGLSISPKN